MSQIHFNNIRTYLQGLIAKPDYDKYDSYRRLEAQELLKLICEDNKERVLQSDDIVKTLETLGLSSDYPHGVYDPELLPRTKQMIKADLISGVFNSASAEPETVQSRVGWYQPADSLGAIALDATFGGDGPEGPRFEELRQTLGM